ncbi:MAG: aspartate aminotransferase family protein [Candidatus Eisenbacteria bacterium]|uniref:Aspartate aminotransferase family protein n=1 Tax=Eiseniibacteriota bacterium TaxID=2212470 RepID=A0A849SV12_UNCEI|nr:aspartate aminotransferase family protein [Candidatus Eisenbacteria bacterium]
MDAAEFRAAGHALVDQLAGVLESIASRPVTPARTPAEVRAAFRLDAPLPEHGAAAGPLLEETARLLFEHSLFNAHPRFFDYITSSPAPIGVLADLLAAAVNSNVGSFVLSPTATEIEAQTVRWVAELIGYPTDCGGVLVSGGNMANMIGFWAARASKADWNVRTAGVAAGRSLRTYASAETHTWLQKAADLAGLGTDSVCFIPTRDDLRMDVERLERQIVADRASGHLPFLVVGTAGSVSTGAVDPLREIGFVCRREGLWFHVDGAYGGFAAAVDLAPADLLAISGADSVAVDPHKWLYAPLEAGCALVRDVDALRKAFSYRPSYYNFGENVLNYVDLGPQNSRGFRALKVWLGLRHAGASGYRRMIADDMALAAALAEAVKAHPELEFCTHELSITTYRFVPADLRGRIGEPAVDAYLDALNREVLERVQSGGEAFVSNAVIRGRYMLRACVVNFNTRTADMAALVVLSARVGRDVDTDLRPSALTASR